MFDLNKVNIYNKKAFDSMDDDYVENVVFSSNDLTKKLDRSNRTYYNCSFLSIDFTNTDFTNTKFVNCNISWCSFAFPCNLLNTKFLHCNGFWGTKIGARNVETATFISHLRYENFTKSAQKYIKPYCPAEGGFIAWKKCSYLSDNEYGRCVVELYIPEDAERTSTYIDGSHSGCVMSYYKCRASKAVVKNIYDEKTGKLINDVKAFSVYHYGTKYRVGETVYPDKYDPSCMVECSNGIHFFMTYEEALNY